MRVCLFAKVWNGSFLAPSNLQTKITRDCFTTIFAAFSFITLFLSQIIGVIQKIRYGDSQFKYRFL